MPNWIHGVLFTGKFECLVCCKPANLNVWYVANRQIWMPGVLLTSKFECMVCCLPANLNAWCVVRQLRMRKLWLDNRGTLSTYYNRGIVIFVLKINILNVLVTVKNTQKLIVKLPTINKPNQLCKPDISRYSPLLLFRDVLKISFVLINIFICASMHKRVVRKLQDKRNMKIEFKMTSLVLVFLALDPEADLEASQRTKVVGASCCHVAYSVKSLY